MGEVFFIGIGTFMEGPKIFHRARIEREEHPKQGQYKEGPQKKCAPSENNAFFWFSSSLVLISVIYDSCSKNLISSISMCICT